jgi:RNA polymerase sigma-70 factor (ECF subfamily)
MRHAQRKVRKAAARQRGPRLSVPFAADRDLAWAARRGDPVAGEAFAQRMRCVGRFIACLSHRHGGALSEHDREDLTSEVTGTVWSRLADYAGLAPLESWVFRYCDFGFRNALRRKRREPAAVPFDEDAVVNELSNGDDFELLERSFARLADDEQSMLRAKYVEELTLAEIASRRGENINTLKSKFHRALVQLRQWMQEWRTA